MEHFTLDVAYRNPNAHSRSDCSNSPRNAALWHEQNPSGGQKNIAERGPTSPANGAVELRDGRQRCKDGTEKERQRCHGKKSHGVPVRLGDLCFGEYGFDLGQREKEHNENAGNNKQSFEALAGIIHLGKAFTARRSRFDHF